MLINKRKDRLNSLVTAEGIGFWINVGAGIATVVLVVIVWIQTRQTQQQMDSTLRPWIGARFRLQFENPQTLMLAYTNYGQIPPQNITAYNLISDKQITRYGILEYSTTSKLDLGTIMPNMNKELRIDTATEQLKSVLAGASFYVGIIIQYSYASKKKGAYGVIYHYRREKQLFEISEEWNY